MMRPGLKLFEFENMFKIFLVIALIKIWSYEIIYVLIWDTGRVDFWKSDFLFWFIKHEIPLV